MELQSDGKRVAHVLKGKSTQQQRMSKETHVQTILYFIRQHICSLRVFFTVFSCRLFI